MTNEVTIKIKLKRLSPGALELRTVAKGRFFKRLYIGWNKKDAVAHFQNWIAKQI